MVVRALHLGTTSSPNDGPSRAIRENLRSARHKTPILCHFSLAGRTISRAGHSHVATLKPMTPLRPLMQASVKPPSPLQPLTQASMKPPSPLLTPEQQPLKPMTPLQPKNTPKTPISHPQRRWRFQPHTGTSEQRRWRFQLAHVTGPQRRQGFQPDASSHEQRRHRFQTTARMVCGHALRHQQAPMSPLPRKLARNLSWSFFETPQNVEIPKNTIQILKQPQGNYVRN